MADTPYDLQSYYYSPQTKQLENLVTAQKIEQAPLLMDKTRAETEKIKAETAESGAKLSKMMTDADAEKAYVDSAKELFQNDPTVKNLPPDELADRIAKYALVKSPQHAISMMGIASKLKTERGTQEKAQREAVVAQNEHLEGAFYSLRSDQNDISPDTLMSMAVNGKMSKEQIASLRNKWRELGDDFNGPQNREKLKQQLIDEVQTSKDRVAKQTAKRDEMVNQVALARLAEVREGHRVDALRLEARMSAGDRTERARDARATNESDARITRSLGAAADEINDVYRDMRSAKNNGERVELIKKVAEAKQAMRDNPMFTRQSTLTKNLEDAQTALEENEAPYKARIAKLTKERESLKGQYSDNFLKRTGQAEAVAPVTVATPETKPKETSKEVPVEKKGLSKETPIGFSSIAEAEKADLPEGTWVKAGDKVGQVKAKPKTEKETPVKPAAVKAADDFVVGNKPVTNNYTRSLVKRDGSLGAVMQPISREIGKVFSTEMEKTISAFQDIKDSGQVNKEDLSIIKMAVAYGQLSPEDEKLAKQLISKLGK